MFCSACDVVSYCVWPFFRSGPFCSSARLTAAAPLADMYPVLCFAVYLRVCLSVKALCKLLFTRCYSNQLFIIIIIVVEVLKLHILLNCILAIGRFFYYSIHMEDYQNSEKRNALFIQLQPSQRTSNAAESELCTTSVLSHSRWPNMPLVCCALAGDDVTRVK